MVEYGWIYRIMVYTSDIIGVLTCRCIRSRKGAIPWPLKHKPFQGLSTQRGDEHLTPQLSTNWKGWFMDSIVASGSSLQHFDSRSLDWFSSLTRNGRGTVFVGTAKIGGRWRSEMRGMWYRNKNSPTTMRGCESSRRKKFDHVSRSTWGCLKTVFFPVPND